MRTWSSFLEYWGDNGWKRREKRELRALDGGRSGAFVGVTNGLLMWAGTMVNFYKQEMQRSVTSALEYLFIPSLVVLGRSALLISALPSFICHLTDIFPHAAQRFVSLVILMMALEMTATTNKSLLWIVAKHQTNQKGRKYWRKSPPPPPRKAYQREYLATELKELVLAVPWFRVCSLIAFWVQSPQGSWNQIFYSFFFVCFLFPNLL